MFKKIFKFAIFLGLGGLIIWWFLRGFSLDERQAMIDSFKGANYGIVVLAMVFGALSFLTRMWRWQMQMESMHYRPKKSNTLMAVMIGYFANLAFPRLGDVVRCVMLDRHEKIPMSKGLGTVVTERFLDVICFVILLVICLIAQFSVLKDYAMENFTGLYEKFTNPAFLRKILIIATICLVLLAFFLFVLRKKIAHTKFYKKLKQVVLNFWEGLISLKNLKYPWLFVLYTVILWFCYFIMAYLVFYAIPETTELPLSAGLACLVFGTIGMIITPGGLGLYPVIIAQVLLLYSISQPVGFAMGWLIWGSQNIFIIFGGLVSLILMPVLNHKKKDKSLS